jgi:hypothetical protein
VRRKADEAKPLVREFVAKWKEDSRLSGERSQKEIKGRARINSHSKLPTQVLLDLPNLYFH